MKFLNKHWKPMPKLVVFKKIEMLSETTDELTNNYEDGGCKYNDFIVGKVIEMGDNVHNVKVGDNIVCTLTDVLNLDDLMSDARIYLSDEHLFSIPCDLIKCLIEDKDLKNQNIKIKK